jgi:hypothetical protein
VQPAEFVAAVNVWVAVVPPIVKVIGENVYEKLMVDVTHGSLMMVT